MMDIKSTPEKKKEKCFLWFWRQCNFLIPLNIPCISDFSFCLHGLWISNSLSDVLHGRILFQVDWILPIISLPLLFAFCLRECLLICMHTLHYPSAFMFPVCPSLWFNWSVYLHFSWWLMSLDLFLQQKRPFYPLYLLLLLINCKKSCFFSYWY